LNQGTPALAGGRVIMSKAFVIEVRSRAAGIVVHDGRRYRFYAAAHEFNGLEGRDFRSPNDAQKAAVGHMAALDSKSAGRTCTDNTKLGAEQRWSEGSNLLVRAARPGG
jgi:hypothetical protein